jgi:hypothetical protein
LLLKYGSLPDKEGFNHRGPILQQRCHILDPLPLDIFENKLLDHADISDPHDIVKKVVKEPGNFTYQLHYLDKNSMFALLLEE